MNVKSTAMPEGEERPSIDRRIGEQADIRE
jgi:hypothetical protein